jgi:hypothetical protein
MILGIFGIPTVSGELDQLALSVGKDPVEVEEYLRHLCLASKGRRPLGPDPLLGPGR